MNNFSQIVTDYVAAFARKDLAALSAMFADDVELRDWSLSARGRAQVLEVNQQIFASCKELRVDLRKLVCEGQTVASELDISIDGAAPVHVVDITEFDASGKIVAIRAFKG